MPGIIFRFSYSYQYTNASSTYRTTIRARNAVKARYGTSWRLPFTSWRTPIGSPCTSPSVSFHALQRFVNKTILISFIWSKQVSWRTCKVLTPWTSSWILIMSSPLPSGSITSMVNRLGYKYPPFSFHNATFDFFTYPHHRIFLNLQLVTLSITPLYPPDSKHFIHLT